MLGVLPVLSAASDGGLTLTAHLAKDGSYSKDGVSSGSSPTAIYVTFTNTSKEEVSVVTAINKPSLAPRGPGDPGAGSVMLASRHGFVGWVNLKEVIPPQSELRIVTLKEGESAGVIVEYLFPRNVKLTELGFVYIVEERLGTRFNVWHGTLSTVLTDRYKIAYSDKDKSAEKR